MFQKIDQKTEEAKQKEKVAEVNRKTLKDWLNKINLSQNESSVFERIMITEEKYCVHFTYRPPREYPATTMGCIVEMTIDPYYFQASLTSHLNHMCKIKEKCQKWIYEQKKHQKTD